MSSPSIVKLYVGQVRQLRWNVEHAKNETQNVRRELAAAVALADERKRLLDIFLCKMQIR